MKDFKCHDTNLFITRHARSRMQQRCFKNSDIIAIFRCGTAITDQEIFFTNKDANREISVLRQQIKVLVRKMGILRVSQCGTVIQNGGKTIVDKDLASELSHFRRQIQIIDRLRNRKIILRGNKVITCYACSRSELKRISRMIH